MNALVRVLLIMLSAVSIGCAYDGWTVNAEYSHNYFKNDNVEADVATINTITGPAIDLFGQDNVELRLAAGSQIANVNNQADSAALISPRLMWYYAPDSFLQFEYDGTFGLDDNGENHLFFAQWEYRFEK